jgi:omega-6 fatty acid desaturase (delta-12 desaturase)
MAVLSGDLKDQVVHSDWFRGLSKYEHPDLKKAIWQLLNTFVPYIALWIIMVRMLQLGVSYWLLIPLIVVAGGLSVRIFIIFHDCGHNSYFKSRLANRIVGSICGVLTFTPYDEWRLAHAEHHASAGDLNRRGVGDIWTMTVEEFRAAPKIKQLWYQIYRNPFVLFVLGPPIMFLIVQRFYHKGDTKQKRNSVINDPCRQLRHLAVLRPAPVRWCLLGAP